MTLIEEGSRKVGNRRLKENPFLNSSDSQIILYWGFSCFEPSSKWQWEASDAFSQSVRTERCRFRAYSNPATEPPVLHLFIFFCHTVGNYWGRSSGIAQSPPWGWPGWAISAISDTWCILGSGLMSQRNKTQHLKVEVRHCNRVNKILLSSDWSCVSS